MNDVYDYAAKFPLRLAGAGTARRYNDIRSSGTTPEQLRWRLRTGSVVRACRGVFIDGVADPDVLDQLRAILLVLPEGAAIALHTAAALHGFGILPSKTLHVMVPAGEAVPQIRGVSAHQAVMPYDAVEVLGLPCVSAARTAVDLARLVRRLDALPVLDAALRQGVCGQDDLRAEVARQNGLRGVRQARELVLIADPRPECRQESQLRLILHDGRLPLPAPQLVVESGPEFAGFRIDLGYQEERVGLEYDGASHLDRYRLRGDRNRHNWLESHGWAMRYFTDHDVYWRPDLIVSTVKTALRSRSRRSRA